MGGDVLGQDNPESPADFAAEPHPTSELRPTCAEAFRRDPALRRNPTESSSEATTARDS